VCATREALKVLSPFNHPHPSTPCTTHPSTPKTEEHGGTAPSQKTRIRTISNSRARAPHAKQCYPRGPHRRDVRVSTPGESIQEQLLHGNVQRFRSGLVFQAHRLLYHSTLSFRSIKERERVQSMRDLPGKSGDTRDVTPLRSQSGGTRSDADFLHSTTCIEMPRQYHPGSNPGANERFLESTPIQIPPRRCGICERMTSDFPSTRLHGGFSRKDVAAASRLLVLVARKNSIRRKSLVLRV
jgi:hypothetical protein